MASARALVVATAGLALTAACAGILGIDDPPPVGVGTSSAPAADAAAADASSDAATTFCGPHPDAALCADFEIPTRPVEYGWTEQRGNVTRVTDRVGSGTGAARGALADAGACSYADLTERVAGVHHHAHLELSLLRSSADGTAAHGQMFTIGGGSVDGGGACVFIFSFDPAPRMEIQRGPNNAQYPFSVDALADTFVRFEVDLDDQAGTTHAVVRANGDVALDLSKNTAPALANCTLGGPIDTSVGLYCDSGNDDVRFDDVLVQVD